MSRILLDKIEEKIIEPNKKDAEELARETGKPFKEVKLFDSEEGHLREFGDRIEDYKKSEKEGRQEKKDFIEEIIEEIRYHCRGTLGVFDEKDYKKIEKILEDLLKFV